jgi:hypothetical protein
MRLRQFVRLANVGKPLLRAAEVARGIASLIQEIGERHAFQIGRRRLVSGLLQLLDRDRVRLVLIENARDVVETVIGLLVCAGAGVFFLEAAKTKLAVAQTAATDSPATTAGRHCIVMITPGDTNLPDISTSATPASQLPDVSRGFPPKVPASQWKPAPARA